MRGDQDLKFSEITISNSNFYMVFDTLYKQILFIRLDLTSKEIKISFSEKKMKNLKKFVFLQKCKLNPCPQDEAFEFSLTYSTLALFSY